VVEEEGKLKRKLSDTEKGDLKDEVSIFFTGSHLEDKRGKRQVILEELRLEIKKMMVESAVQRKLEYYISAESHIKRAVGNFNQLKSMWRFSGKNETFKSMIQVCFLDFDTTPNWKEKLETWILSRHDLEYLGAPPEGKRIPSRSLIILVNKAKQDVVKSLKKVGLSSHGRSLGLRDNELQLELTDKGKRVRRKPGVFYEHFYQFCPQQETAKSEVQHVRKSPRKKVSKTKCATYNKW
jgi:hypothetical protein